MTKTELKQTVKEALLEVLESKPEILEQAMLKAFEDLAFVKAISEGDQNKYVNFDKFMNDLDKRVNEPLTSYGNKN